LIDNFFVSEFDFLKVLDIILIVAKENAEKLSGQVLNQAFQGGLRTANLENQPAPWVTLGLQRLEAGGRKRINARTIRRANNSQTSKLP
jgi:hypothetical protein